MALLREKSVILLLTLLLILSHFSLLLEKVTKISSISDLILSLLLKGRRLNQDLNRRDFSNFLSFFSINNKLNLDIYISLESVNLALQYIK